MIERWRRLIDRLRPTAIHHHHCRQQLHRHHPSRSSHHLAPNVALLSIILISILLSGLTADAQRPSGNALFRAYRSAIPAHIFDRMESDCRAMADYEARLPAHTSGKRTTRWFPVGARPRTSLEAAILHLARLSRLGEDRLVGYEWWIQRVESDRGSLGFHVDKDEAVATNEHYLLHPLWSSITYITREGGGTFITDQYSPTGNGYDPVQPRQAAWSFPEPNKFLLFNGTLLHGVIAPSDVHHAGLSSPAVQRLTFLVNFWHIRPKEPNCQRLRHDQVDGLTLLTEDEIEEIEAEFEAGTHKARRQPLANILLTQGSLTPSFPYRMDLPGGGHQMIRLPELKTTAGQTYLIHYDRPEQTNKQRHAPTQAQTRTRRQEHTSGEAKEDDGSGAKRMHATHNRSKKTTSMHTAEGHADDDGELRLSRSSSIKSSSKKQSRKRQRHPIRGEKMNDDRHQHQHQHQHHHHRLPSGRFSSRTSLPLGRFSIPHTNQHRDNATPTNIHNSHAHSHTSTDTHTDTDTDSASSSVLTPSILPSLALKGMSLDEKIEAATVIKEKIKRIWAIQ